MYKTEFKYIFITLTRPKIRVKLINLHTKSEQFSLVDSTIYDIFSSTLYDGIWYAEKSEPERFVISKNFKSLLGYQPNQRLLWNAIILPQDLNIFQKQISNFSIKESVETHKTIRFVTTNGTILWLESHFYSKPNTENGSQFIFIAFKDISKQKNREIDLIAQQKKNHQILNESGIGTWEYNLITKEVIFSKSCADIIGYTVDELRVMKDDIWNILTHPDDIKKPQRLLDEYINSKSTSFVSEVRLKHKNGQWVWIVDTGKILSYDPDGEPEWIGGVHYDITDRKNGELLLQHYRNMLERINVAAEIGIWELDLETNQLQCSDEIKKIVGVPLSYEATFENAIDFIKEGESRQKMINSVKNAMQNGEGYDIEIEAVTTSAKVLWTRSIGIPEFSNGKCTRFYGFFQNIHEKTIATKELILKEEFFRKTFFHAPVGMAIVDIEGNITQLNKNLSKFLGYTKKEILLNKFGQFSHPEDIDLGSGLIKDLLLNKSESFILDKRYIHKDGSILWGQISVSSVRTENRGKITHFVVQVQDITERKKNDLLLSNYQDLLERSNYVAKIGTWEIDIIDHTVSWSRSLSNILNTRDHIVPTFQESIDYFAVGSHRETMQAAVKEALEKGVNFDKQILVNTEHGTPKWVRMIGISEFENGVCQRLYGLIQDINDIKKSQLVIAHKEEQWRTTFNHTNAGIALLNFEGKANNVNKSMGDIFGYSMKEMQQIGIKNISVSEDLESNINLMNDLIDGKIDSFIEEKQFLHKKGHVFWANVSVSAVKNDYNQFTHMVAQVIDITESKTNQLLLKKYKDILERSNEVAKIGSWELEPDSQTLFWSDHLGWLFGNTEYRPKCLNDSIINYVLEENQERITFLLNDAIDYGTNFDFEIQLKTGMGLRWMRMIGISDFQDGSCKSLHGLIQDIEEFKSAQLEILLREEEFRQTFWHAPLGMALLDLNGNVVRVNPRMCETFGYTEKELIEMQKSVISYPEDLETTNNLMQQILSGERESFQQEKRYVHKNQNLIWAILSISAVRNDKGETTHFVSQVSDITDKKLLSESLKEHNNRLLNYAHIVSHNLRSHTGNLTMLLELSEINQKEGFDQELFEHIKAASNNMNETVNHLSEIVEINNFIKDTLVPHNLNKRVKKSLQNVQATLREINGEVSLKVNKDFMVYAVSSYMDSIILNILTNAIKYRSPFRLLKIKITSGKKDGFKFLSITDNGLGIDLEKHGTKIFGMYKTFHDTKNARGIGLFISKNQIEAMGGTIEVKSELNIGTTFTIYFKDEKN